MWQSSASLGGRIKNTLWDADHLDKIDYDTNPWWIMNMVIYQECCGEKSIVWWWLAGMDHLLIHGGNDRDLLYDDNVQCPEAPASDLFNPWVKRPIQKTHLTNTVESEWNTWCETLSDTGKLPIPLGGYKLTSLKLRRLNNLTHKRLRERCVDWKSIGCP